MAASTPPPRRRPLTLEELQQIARQSGDQTDRWVRSIQQSLRVEGYDVSEELIRAELEAFLKRSS